ncbi:Ubiquitin-conjugating enzyme [Penicillium malachiteum]|uniref:Ubiquitin-conjugating enzyme n=1 Tax=Penicillium malachiteum TaxID=1324776 RepID=A0AAD6HF30_9EURO|nr:Ubiquitin-conjugating enzyme [Penicillium malachiteum]
MTSPSTKRLLKESTDLHKNPSPYFTASPINDTNLHDWHFTLTGPPSTPYSTGLYHGRITFPPTYPLRPPSFRFLTPSGRFEVNREICLSISGHHEETWQPAWGVRTALLAIRSEIMGGESKGQVGGMEGTEEVRLEFARGSSSWTCRECGVSNEGIMRKWWGVCVERGVEVDVEGFKIEKGEKSSESEDVSQAETPQPQSQSQSLSETQLQSQTPLQPTVEVEPSTPLPRTTEVAQVSPTQSTALLRSTATQATRTVVVESPTEPANSPWLDRAIIVVVLALILLMLRRTLDVDDL